ncbi:MULTISPECIES: DnaB-like helicase C-terminal domain-containing protein [unclassified Meiothermus]|uniref:replicative DNA helicase n=1 Tax=unclassified Meiothermus TaxID=370471 RepID=UPI000D7CD2F1|nr:MULTISPECIES: DnaB-like helicase C-terminal domain-containing protein [unclassified Meiothermus]PZA06501.1 hypothetical protein DNA98_13015 [Meiothermus sp. Pnk-1]RYM37174.1 hypothetical protein EWH23_06775 [Meiothermus sp. PNK-Is4]
MQAQLSLPASPAAERNLVGAVLLDATALDAALSAGVVPDDFSEVPLRRAWEAILAAFHGGQPLTPVVLGGLGADPALLMELMAATAGAAAWADSYARMVRDAAERRRLIQLALKAASEAASEAPLDAVWAKLLDARANAGSAGQLKTFAEMAEGLLEALMSGESGGMPTGFPTLDRLSGAGGLYRDLNILAARPSQGKTQAALQIIEHVAEQGASVLFINMDTPEEQIRRRQVAYRLGMTANDLREGIRNNPAILQRAKAAIEELKRLPIHYRCGPTSILDVRLAARQLRARGDLGLIVVDYLQQVSTGNDRHDEFERVTIVSRSLKDLASELEVPVLALSQLSRGTESRNDKRPKLSDLRQSGQVEQDAAMVIALYRPHYYDREANPNEAEWLLLKQKDGPVGTIHMRYNPGTGFGDVGEFSEN